MRDLATEMTYAWSLAKEGQYQKAVDLCDEAKSRGLKLSAPFMANCGIFLLCLQKYDEASAKFAEATAQRKMSEGSYLDSQGSALWLMGKHKDAVAAWRYRVSNIFSGKIHYADSAGGASDGLLLWYAAVTLKDSDLLEDTRKYFHKLSTDTRISIWPGPLVYLALGEKSAEALLQEHFGDKELGRLLYKNQGVLQRRELINALFYSAVSRRAAGQENECRKLMATVVQIQNPLLELEWYLARGELAQSSGEGLAKPSM